MAISAFLMSRIIRSMKSFETDLSADTIEARREVAGTLLRSLSIDKKALMKFFGL